MKFMDSMLRVPLRCRVGKMTIFTGARLDHTTDPMAVSRARGSFCDLCGTNTRLMP